jgi:HK97 family phage major capsid protein
MSHALIKRLHEERTNAWEQAKALLDAAEAEGRDLTAEENQTYDTINERMGAIDERVTKLREDEERAKASEDAFAALLATPQQRQAPKEDDGLRAFLKGETRAFEVKPDGPVDFRDLTKGTATAGGNTVPTSFYNQLIAHMIEVSGLLQAGPTILRTDSGENIDVPTTTAHSTGALVTEGSAIGESDPAFTKRTLGAYKYGVLIQVSTELLTDTGVDLTGYLSMEAGRAIGNALGADLVTGNGSSKPSGVVQTATSGVTGGTGVVGAFTADNLIDLYYSVISPYRNSPSCGWLLRDASLATVRKLKDSSTGTYLWQPALTAGAPDMLLGKPVHTDPNVAAVAVSAKSVLFGDFSRYFVRLAGGVRFERSDEYAFNADLTTFRALVRGDGVLVDQTGAVKYFAGGAS